MSDNDTTAETAPQDALEAPEPQTDADTPDTDEPAGNPAGGREAAKYRTQLRAAEKEIGQLRELVTFMQRADAERIAATLLNDPADLWHDGAELAAMLNDDGHLDPAKVAAIVREVIAAHPHWKTPARRPATLDGQRSGTGGADVPTTTWHQAFNDN